MKDIKLQIIRAKKRLLEMHYKANAGHIGGNLSCMDATMLLFHKVMKQDDRFVLSKGHAVGTLYITLWSMGKLTETDLKSFSCDDTSLPGHPTTGLPSVLFPTGSLGHGPSLAAGLALSALKQQKSHQVFCLCSDGEWQEGSCWEALIFATHQKLNNLTILIDQNRLQGFGETKDIISCENLNARLKAFCPGVLECDGHNAKEILEKLQSPRTEYPKIILLNTIKGKGTCYEGQMESHYLPLSHENYTKAMEQLNKEEHEENICNKRN